jgi:DNA-binding transcriptional LysR family regulator
MRLESLRHFVVLANVLNYSEAANRLYISQSALSKSIIKLEADLNALLFDRTTRNVRLTTLGRELLPVAELMVRQAGQVEQIVRKYRSGGEYPLRVAACSTLHLYGLSEMIMSYRAAFPESHLQVDEYDMRGVFQALEAGEADIGIVRTNVIPRPEEFEIFPLADDELMVLCGPGHRFASRSCLPLEEVLTEPKALFKGGWEEYCCGLRMLGYTLRQSALVALCQNPNTLVSFLRNNQTVSFMMSAMARQLAAEKQLVLLPFTKPLRFPLGIIVPRGAADAAAHREFIDYAMEKTRPYRAVKA